VLIRKKQTRVGGVVSELAKEEFRVERVFNIRTVSGGRKLLLIAIEDPRVGVSPSNEAPIMNEFLKLLRKA